MRKISSHILGDTSADPLLLEDEERAEHQADEPLFVAEMARRASAYTGPITPAAADAAAAAGQTRALKPVAQASDTQQQEEEQKQTDDKQAD